MSQYTDSVSRPGRAGAAGTDNLQLYLRESGEMVLEAWDETCDYQDFAFVKNVTQGKSDLFPVIGRKRDALDHEPGELILGGGIDHNEVEITMDKIVVDSVFIADFDEYLLHYSVRSAYSKQIGQSLASTISRRCAIMHILASRAAALGVGGAVTPSYYYDANVKTDGAKLEAAAYAGVEFIKTNEVGGGMPDARYKLPWQQYLLLARYSGIEAGPVTTGSGNRAQGTVGQIAGLSVTGTNHIPKTNITTGLTKYQGDFSTTVGHIGTNMAVGNLRRAGIKLTVKEHEDRLGTLMIGSTLQGFGKLRPECSFEVATTVRP